MPIGCSWWQQKIMCTAVVSVLAPAASCFLPAPFRNDVPNLWEHGNYTLTITVMQCKNGRNSKDAGSTKKGKEKSWIEPFWAVHSWLCPPFVLMQPVYNESRFHGSCGWAPWTIGIFLAPEVGIAMATAVGCQVGTCAGSRSSREWN